MPADPSILHIKVTKPVTNVKFETGIGFRRINLIDVKGIDSCIVYLSEVYAPWCLSNLDEVYPGDTIFLKESNILGIYPSHFENNVTGNFYNGSRINTITLRISKLDGSEPEFNTPIMLTIRVVAK